MMQGLNDADSALAYMGGGGFGVSGPPTGPGNGGNGGGGLPKPTRNKQPKGLKSQIAPKIKLCGAKLMDVKLWLNKVKESHL